MNHIGVGEEQPVAARLRRAQPRRVALPYPACRQLARLDYPQPRNLRSQAGQKRCSAVRGVVVNDDYFADFRLRSERTHRSHDIQLFVARRDDGADDHRFRTHTGLAG